MKKAFVVMLVLALILSLCACAQNVADPTGTQSSEAQTTAAQTNAPETANTPDTNAPETSAEETDAKVEGIELNVYSLKGPTSMGLVSLLRDSEEGKTFNTYNSTMCTGADEVTAALINGSADIALLPANAAANLFNKAGGFSVVAINTLGVLYVVENGDTVNSVEDLAGKTVCLTGKGTTPEYSLRYLLAAYGIEDNVTLEFKSEAQEVVAAIGENVATIGLLPQPFVTVAMMQNEKLRVALDLNSEWNTVSENSSLVTGVTVVRNEVLEQHPENIRIFLEEAAKGVDQVNSDPETAAQLIVDMGIVAKAPIALKAIPYCNLVCITGSGMKEMLSGYLETLYSQNPKAVGEAMPADAFYYTGE